MKENGYSLIEVVASILIISIILLSFFTFFIQSKKSERVNEDKYTTIQLSEELVYILENSVYNTSKPNEIWNLYYDTSISNEKDYSLSINDKLYYINVETKSANEVNNLLPKNYKLLKLTLFTYINGERKEVITNYAYKKE